VYSTGRCGYASCQMFDNLGSRRTRSEEHTSELQSRFDLVCRLLLEKKKMILVFLFYIRLTLYLKALLHHLVTLVLFIIYSISVYIANLKNYYIAIKLTFTFFPSACS